MESPLKRQLLLVGLITKLLEEKGKEEAPVEIVELEEGLHCTIIGIEDLILDRMNACKRWGSEIDCE
ncbi:MAG: hypothetical protein HXY46_07385 [Syntrophaceae bacterium]|nr:hypothetical protein [Syntrophaceae bacterium]